MTILYTQVLRLRDYKILSCTFSSHGKSIQANDMLFIELRNAIKRIPDTSQTKIYDMLSKDNSYTFYIKTIYDIAVCLITDSAMSKELVNQFIIGIENKINEINIDNDKQLFDLENTLKVYCDKMNNEQDHLMINMELTNTRDECYDSLNKIIKRGEVLDEILTISEQLKAASKNYNSKTKSLYYKEKMREYAIYLLTFVFIFIFLYFFLLR